MIHQRKLTTGWSRRTLAFEAMEARWVMDSALGSPAFDAADGESTAMPDFHLVDLNPASPRYQQSISPRDYLQQVSAWYFTHST